MRRLVAWTIGLVASVAATAAAPQPASLPTAPAAEEPRLPDAPPPIAPLRRGPDGQIEVVDPASTQRAGESLCSKGAICVGPGQRYRTLAAGLEATRDGDLIELVGGTYRTSASLARRKLTLRGVAGRAHIDCAGAALAGERACLLLAADGITLDNLEVSGAAPADGSDGMAACIANEPGLDFSVSRLVCHDSQNGIVAHGGTIVILESEFYNNGWNKGSNNAAFDDGCLLTVRGSTFRDARTGAELMSRCTRTTITDSNFRSISSNVILDLPDGGETLVYRSTLEKMRDAAGGDIIRFSADSCRYPGTVVFKEVRIVNALRDTALRNYDRCFGNAIVLDRVTFEGVPPRQFGYILAR
jgi:hypothetical protein